MTVDQLHDLLIDKGPALVFLDECGDPDACLIGSPEHQLLDQNPEFADSIVGTYDASVSYADLKADIRAARG
jgi:hypothetical protein